MKATDNVYPMHAENSAGYFFTGLKARDYIAIQAMISLNANPGLNDRNWDDIADMAYNQVDAMIKRSEVKDDF